MARFIEGMVFSGISPRAPRWPSLKNFGKLSGTMGPEVCASLCVTHTRSSRITKTIFIGNNDRKANGWMFRRCSNGKLVCLRQIRNLKPSRYSPLVPFFIKCLAFSIGLSLVVLSSALAQYNTGDSQFNIILAMIYEDARSVAHTTIHNTREI